MREKAEPIDDSAKRYLLRRAREAIAATIDGRTIEDEPAPEQVHDTQCGVFVSLHQEKAPPKGVPGGELELRGCIGHIRSRQPLDREIVAVARQAAFSDCRFEPLATRKELDQTVIEISLLSPFESVDDIGEIRPGLHGVYIELEGHSALLLPQVAGDRGWDRITLLQQLCRKAGRRDRCWEHPAARLYRFEARVFDEKSLGVR